MTVVAKRKRNARGQFLSIDFCKRYWEKVRIDGDKCWEWLAEKNAKGYGRIYYRGKLIMAHRKMWEFYFGIIPKGLLVLHHCDNPSCVNPAHLFLGTHRDNMKDMVMKGHSTRGENHPSAILTVREVRNIRDEAQTPSARHRLAGKYGVTYRYIYEVQTKRSWRWLK